ncbi:MAG TPA: PDZ domain-containing protein [Verrucomicrobiae bacterium]|jgi:hypothetical protein|nr:PDZ domain-containing protein [Verrucomicrobiae bacterium]
MKKQMNRACEFQSTDRTNHIDCPAGLLLLCFFAVLAAGCSTSKPKPKPEAVKMHQRGWIGGEFELAQKPFTWRTVFGTRDEYVAILPRGLASSNRAGILITALSSNAPAREAGLREGDLILNVNHQPVTTLKAFRQSIDKIQPGTSLPVTAWRDGRSFECNVQVGREKFENWANFTIGIGLPNLSNFGHFDLWPNPGFDLWALGFEQDSGDRTELSSAESIYRRACNGGEYKPSERDWDVWLVIFSVARGKNIQSQEIFSPTNSPLPGVGKSTK